MFLILGMLQAHEVTVWTAVVVVLLLGFWAFMRWMSKRDFTAVRKAVLKSNDPEQAMRLAEKMLDADVQRARDRPPPGRHRA